MAGAARRGLTWTPERIETLKSLAALGLSSTLISERFGIGRGAVIRKCQRLGITLMGVPGRRRHPNKPRKLKPKVSSSGASPERRTAPPASSSPPDGAELLSESGTLTLLELKENHCRYMIGDLFCGKATCDRGSGSYCKAHADRCYDGVTLKFGLDHPHSNLQFTRSAA